MCVLCTHTIPFKETPKHQQKNCRSVIFVFFIKQKEIACQLAAIRFLIEGFQRTNNVSVHIYGHVILFFEIFQSNNILLLMCLLVVLYTGVIGWYSSM